MAMVAQRSFYKHMDDKNASVIKQIIIRVLLGGPIKNTRRPRAEPPNAQKVKVLRKLHATELWVVCLPFELVGGGGRGHLLLKDPKSYLSSHKSAL